MNEKDISGKNSIYKEEPNEKFTMKNAIINEKERKKKENK